MKTSYLKAQLTSNYNNDIHFEKLPTANKAFRFMQNENYTSQKLRQLVWLIFVPLCKKWGQPTPEFFALTPIGLFFLVLKCNLSTPHWCTTSGYKYNFSK